MLNLAIKQLLLEKQKSAITIFALAALIAVIFILKGFEQGQYYQLRQLVLNRDADLIVTQAGIKNFIATRSVIPQTARAEVEAVAGVVEAHPITAIPIIYNNKNIRTPIYVIVFDTLGGPANLTAGRVEQKGNSIVIDQALARKYHLTIGDPLVVSDFEFTITGVTKEAAFMMPFAFINYDGMIDLFLESDIAPDLSTFPLLSFMLVEVASGYQKPQVAQAIKAAVADVDVFSTEEIANNDVDLGRTFFRPIMGVLVSVGYVIGLLVISLIMYSEINGSRKNYSVLKALGFQFSQLIALVFFFSTTLLVVALPVAVILALIIAFSIEISAPVYLIKIFEPSVMINTMLACLVFSLFGGLVPLIPIKRCDPMLAFQAS